MGQGHLHVLAVLSIHKDVIAHSKIQPESTELFAFQKN